MHPRRSRAGELFGTMERIPGQDGVDSQNSGPRRFSHDRGFGFNILSQGGDALAVGFLREMSPAGERGEGHRLDRRILEAVILLSANPSRMLLAAIEPVAGQRSAFKQGSKRVYAGPIQNPLYKLLFDALRQNILENLHLGSFLVGDDGHFVAAVENWSAPTRHAVSLQSQLRFEVPHKISRLFHIVDDRQQVEVGRQDRDRAELDSAVSLGLPEDTQEDVVEFRSWTEQVASVDGPAGDVDEGLGLGDVA